MKLTSCRSTSTASGPWFFQFKLNSFFNEHFPELIFFSKVFFRLKTDEVEVNCYRKKVQEMVTPTNRVFARAEFTLCGAPSTLGIFGTSFCQIEMKNKNSRTI